MNIFLSISIAFILCLFILKIFYEIKKLNNKINKLQGFLDNKAGAIEEKKYVEEKSIATNFLDLESLDSIEIKVINTNKETTPKRKRVKPRRKSVEPLQDNNTNSETPPKNSFLYGAEDFGEMKKGVVLESNTFTYNKEDKGDGFEII